MAEAIAQGKTLTELHNLITNLDKELGRRVLKGENSRKVAIELSKQWESQWVSVDVLKPLAEAEKGKILIDRKQLEDRSIRLLLERAGGRYIDNEAGMLYQTLLLLGMKDQFDREQVKSLETVTCHYFSQDDARKVLTRLLQGSKETGKVIHEVLVEKKLQQKRFDEDTKLWLKTHGSGVPAQK